MPRNYRRSAAFPVSFPSFSFGWLIQNFLSSNLPKKSIFCVAFRGSFDRRSNSSHQQHDRFHASKRQWNGLHIPAAEDIRCIGPARRRPSSYYFRGSSRNLRCKGIWLYRVCPYFARMSSGGTLSLNELHHFSKIVVPRGWIHVGSFRFVEENVPNSDLSNEPCCGRVQKRSTSNLRVSSFIMQSVKFPASLCRLRAKGSWKKYIPALSLDALEVYSTGKVCLWLASFRSLIVAFEVETLYCSGKCR